MSVEKRKKEQEKTSMVVEGFLFANEAEAAQARKEAEGVKYVKEKAQMDDPEMVLHIYNKMIQQRLFDTAVGYSYPVSYTHLRDYGGLDNATFYASTGLGIYDMWTEKFCEVDGEKTTLEDALSRRQFGKIYFQIGINEDVYKRQASCRLPF